MQTLKRFLMDPKAPQLRQCALFSRKREETKSGCAFYGGKEEEIESTSIHIHRKGAAVDNYSWRENEAIDIDNFLWADSMVEKLGKYDMLSRSMSSICRVPQSIRKHDHNAYNPWIVSIGPFHRQRQNLKVMEEHKLRYLHKVLNRSKAGNNLKNYLNVMKAIEPRARSCYSENIKMEVNEFAKMMLLDGCFIIQLLLQQDHVEKDDPIDSTQWMLPSIGHDMLLLENQIPFCILECLWDHIVGPPMATLKVKALRFLLKSTPKLYGFHIGPPNEAPVDHLTQVEPPPEGTPVDHLLHLVHLSIRPTDPKPKIKSKSTVPKTISSATKLKEAGVKFQLVQPRRFYDITFKNGTMEIPRIVIDDNTGSFFRNFIAFEQCFPKHGNYFTSYSLFMDFLVNTPRDVEILNNANIMEHMLGSDNEVALLFNKLSRGIASDIRKSYLANLVEDVRGHTERSWPTWRAKLVHDYFSNPWTIISLLAATCVIFLQSVQTYGAVFPKCNHIK